MKILTLVCLISITSTATCYTCKNHNVFKGFFNRSDSQRQAICETICAGGCRTENVIAIGYECESKRVKKNLISHYCHFLNNATLVI